MKHAPAALIFDFDGLIIDTETPAFEAWQAIFAEHGAELNLKTWVRCVGSAHSGFDPVTHLEELCGRSVNRPALEARKQHYKLRASQQAPLRPGVRERIEEAQQLGWRIGLASSSESGWVLPLIDQHQLTACFSTIITREDVTRTKPWPDLYLKAASRLGVDPGAALVFEDSLNGLKAAQAAGMRCIVVPNPVTAGLEFPGALRVATSLADVRLAEVVL